MTRAADQLLASPTLVRLYLAQGHLRRALDLCKQLSNVSPDDGTLLALGQRIELLIAPRLSVARGGDGHVIRWSGLDAPASLVICSVRAHRGPRFTSIPTTRPAGTAVWQCGQIWIDREQDPSVTASGAEFRESATPEAISVCLARLEDRTLKILATACSDAERVVALASGSELG